MSKKKKYDSRDVVTISGTIWNDNTRTVANALNINAEILKQAMDRLAVLEAGVLTKTEGVSK